MSQRCSSSKLSNHGRTISKRQATIFTILIAIILLLLDLFNIAKADLSHAIIYLIPALIFILPDFRIIYNVNVKEIKNKVLRLLDAMFCKYQKKPQKNFSVEIENIGKISVYKLSIVGLMIIKKNKNSPKADIIFKNIFKIFYDNEY